MSGQGWNATKSLPVGCLNDSTECNDLRCLEIGAGSGKNIPSLLRFGVPISNITANELLEDRLSELKEAFPDIQTISGNALEIEDGPYDIILISTVLSSILDLPFRRELSAHLLQQLSDQRRHSVVRLLVPESVEQGRERNQARRIAGPV